MIPKDLQIPALVLGAVVLLAAVLSGMLLRNAARTAPARFLRAAIAVAGLALMAWALASDRVSRRHPASAPALVQAAPTVVSARDLVGTAGDALEACALPVAPALPDSARASLDQMQAARTAFEAYDAATNTYTQCVDSVIKRTATQYQGVASESDLQALDAFGARAHNAALDREKAIVDQFNAQVRAYTAKHPK